MTTRTARLPLNANGFTLLELLVVIAILGLLATFATPQVIGYLGRAKADTAKIQVQALMTTVDLYRMDVGTYPKTEEGLPALVSQPAGSINWRGPYLRNKEAITDPWGTPYGYRLDERGARVFSLGADRREGGEGENADVSSR